jgi:hypothetical protein
MTLAKHTNFSNLDPMPTPERTTSHPSSAVRSTFLDSHVFSATELDCGANNSNDMMQWRDFWDFPFRRVRLYSNLVWGSDICAATNNTASVQEQSPPPSSNEECFGLAWYLKPYVDAVCVHPSSVLVRDAADADDTFIKQASDAHSSRFMQPILPPPAALFAVVAPNRSPDA